MDQRLARSTYLASRIETDGGVAMEAMQAQGGLDLLQWPAMVATVAASWLVTSRQPARRRWAFWLYLLSNVMWVAWGWHTSAWALVVLQFCLAAINIRGARKNAEG